MLIWFDAHPLARVVAERERESRDGTLNLRAKIAHGDAKAMISSTFDRALPERLRQDALSRGLEIMLAAGDFLGVTNLITDGLTLRRWPKRVVPALQEPVAHSPRRALHTPRRLYAQQAPSAATEGGRNTRETCMDARSRAERIEHCAA